MQIIQQTTECAWFVRDYMKIENFCKLYKLFFLCTHCFEGKQMARDIASSQKDQVDKFKSKFDELRSAFQAEGIVQIKITVLQVVDDLQSIRKDLTELGMYNYLLVIVMSCLTLFLAIKEQLRDM